MNSQDEAPIPVTILTGFLGAGKTTLLNHILNSADSLRVAVLVNDFGKINIDSQIVVNVDDDTIELANGCICCTIRGDLLNALIDLIQRDNPPEYIVIEASGVSDPLEIAITFKQDILRSRLRIDAVLTVVDAEQILDLERENEVLAVLQVGAADIVIVNKTDLVDEEALVRVRIWIHSIIANTRIVEASFCRVPLPLILGVGAFSPERLQQRTIKAIHTHEPTTHHHDHHDIVFDTWYWTSDQPLILRTLKRSIEQIPSDIYRIKGFVRLTNDPSQILLLQVAGKRATLTPVSSPITDSHCQLVFIGAHGAIDIDYLQRVFDRAKSDTSTRSSIAQFASPIISWIRGINNTSSK